MQDKFSKGLQSLEILLEDANRDLTNADNEDNSVIKNALISSCEQNIADELDQIKKRFTPKEFFQLEEIFIKTLTAENKTLWDRIIKF